MLTVCVGLATTAANPGAPRADLTIHLASDKASYTVGEEVHLRVELVNHSRSAFEILELTQFLGDELVVQAPDGQPVALEGGPLTYSPKANLFTGTHHRLSPGGRWILRLDALVDFRRRLVFEERRAALPDRIDSDLRQRYGLPEDYPTKYVGTGRVFPLGKPGRYRLQFVYDHVPTQGVRWQIVSDPEENQRILDALWVGQAASNTIEIEIR